MTDTDRPPSDDDPEKLSELNDLVGQVAKAGEDRNAVIHSFWLGLKSGKALRFKLPWGRKKWFQAHCPR